MLAEEKFERNKTQKMFIGNVYECLSRKNMTKMRQVYKCLLKRKLIENAPGNFYYECLLTDKCWLERNLR